MKPIAALVAAAVALGVPSFAGAQSLAEIAEKEKERRKAAKKPAKTFTESDLKRGGMSTFNAQVGEGSSAPADASAPATSPSPDAGGAKPKSSDELRAEKQKQLQARLDEQKKLADVVRKAKAEAEQELGDVANMSVGTRRQQVQKLVDDSNAKLAEIQGAVDGILDEARRAGVVLSQ
jgi:hypothetical protein